MRKFITTVFMLAFWIVIGFCVWFITMRCPSFIKFDNDNLNFAKGYLSIIAYSIGVIYFNAYFGKAATKIVVAENH